MKPFDLEAAKRGEPIQTRDGTPVKFIAHVPDAYKGNRVITMISGIIYCADENGIGNFDLFMAPGKRTVWVNLYEDILGRYYSHTYPTKKYADAGCTDKRIGNRAWPLEIEE